MLLALISQEEGVVFTLLQKLGVNIEGLKKKVQVALEKIPNIVAPQALGQFYLTQDMARILERARQEALKMADEFISVEHLFLALLDADTKAKEVVAKAALLQQGGTATLEFGKLDYETALKTLKQIQSKLKINGKIDNKTALNYLMLRDSEKIVSAIKNNKIIEPEKSLEINFKRYIDLLKKNNLLNKTPEYEITAKIASCK